MKADVLAAWTDLLRNADIQQCAIVHDVVIGAIDAQIYRRDHPTPRYRELISLELVVIQRVKSLGGYSEVSG